MRETTVDKDHIVFLSWHSQGDILRLIKKYGYKLSSIYRLGQFKFVHIIRELGFRIGLAKSSYWYNASLKNYSGTIIIFDALISLQSVIWLKKNAPCARIIFWYWNNLTAKSIPPAALRAIGCETWSFNWLDCQKFDMNYNHQFYIPIHYESIKRSAPTSKIYDLVFVGKDKGRLKRIRLMQTRNVYASLKWFTYVVADHFYLRWTNKKYRPMISYKKMLALHSQGKAILELTMSENAGITLRTMDALFLQQKLVTDNKNIRYSPFYDPDNIFIIGIDDDSRINDFLELPYKKVSKEVIDSYSFQDWVTRFFMSQT